MFYCLLVDLSKSPISSHTTLLQSIAKKSALHCRELKTWSPIVDLCKLNKIPIPKELFDSLIKKNQWMELLIACDIFDIPDVSSSQHFIT